MTVTEMAAAAGCPFSARSASDPSSAVQNFLVRREENALAVDQNNQSSLWKTTLFSNYVLRYKIPLLL